MTPLDKDYFPETWDSSMIATGKACAQLLKKVYFDQWKSKEPNVHLRAGGAFAHGIERARRAFYEEGHDAETSVATGIGALLEFYSDFQCPQDSAKSAERTAGALEYYFDHYPLNHETSYPIILPGGKRAIEISFAQPLAIDHPVTGQPLIYCGRLDAILSTLGDTFGCDEKTTTSLGPTWGNQWGLRGQFLGYKWGARQYGIRVAGIVVRGVSILKTKYDTQESINYYPDWMIDRWEGELLEWLSEFIQWWKTKRFRYNFDSSCASYGGCGFNRVCSSSDEKPWLETYFERRHWNPVTREETLLK